ncbi:MAG: hypothetical protein K2X39_06260, partial [Silvanigrellaceae bacterium]|nr:hypothetical protein [Silvanigrellaceae bacterium]
NSNLKVYGKTASFTYRSRWGLLQFLKTHGSKSSAQKKTQLLSFTVPIVDPQKSGLAGFSTATDFANCFINVTVLSPDKRLTMSVPLFPREAPLVKLK